MRPRDQEKESRDLFRLVSAVYRGVTNLSIACYSQTVKINRLFILENTEIMKTTTVICAFLILAFNIQLSAHAQTNTTQVICETAKGIISVKNKCTRNETRISTDRIKEIAAKGPPSGTTLTGLIGGRLDFHKSGASDGPTLFEYVASVPMGQYGFPIDQILFKSGELSFFCGTNKCFSSQSADAGNVCTGNTNNPTAPAGVVCLYLHMASGYQSSLSDFNIDTSNSNSGIRLTFSSNITANAEESAGVIFDWAYTVP